MKPPKNKYPEGENLFQTSEPNQNVGEDRMKAAYELSSDLVKDRIRNESEEDFKLLESTVKDDVIVVEGTYDHIHNVLDLTKIPYTRINPEDVDRIDFRPDQTVFVNCGTSFPVTAARTLAGFVASGGQLITTDWALKYVLEVGFPGFVQYNGKPSADEVVRIEIVDREDPVLKGFLDETADPVWWLEGSSYPIQILNTNEVKVLIKSKELAEKYGESPVVIKFEHGKGVVYHMISHFYLQRTETRDQKHTSSATMYASEKGASASTMKKFAEMEQNVDDLDFGAVQSANTSTEFISRALIGQKKKFSKK